MRRIIKAIALWGIGGSLYIIIELLWRGYSHISMFILGGICFLYAGYQNEYTAWDRSLWKQVLKVDVFILCAEFIAGCVINLWLGMDVWDYSNVPCNLLGQVCLPYAILWLPLSLLAIVFDDYIRYWFFEEEKPHYKLFRTKSR